MPKKKAAKAAAISGRSKGVRQNNQKKRRPKRKTKPPFLVCPDSGEKVWVTQATLQNVKEAAQKKKHPFAANRQYLVTVPSPSTRQAVYDQAAMALADLETRVLPEYGGRAWTCWTKVSDATSSGGGPYFRFYQGQLELAAWPHLVQRLPDPPRFAGYSSGPSAAALRAARARARAKAKESSSSSDGEDHDEKEENKDEAEETNEGEQEEEESSESEESDESDDDDDDEPQTPEERRMHQLQERPVSTLSTLAFEDRWRVPLPQVSYKWISPLHETFTTRKSAWERAQELCKHEVFLDKILRGYGANGQELKVKKQTQKDILKAGKLRFERDGLWVVGQEDVWQQERLEAEGDLKPAAKVTAARSDCKDTPKTPTGTGEEPPKKRAKRLSGLCYYLECNRKEHRDRRLQQVRAKSSNSSNPNSLVENVEYGSDPEVLAAMASKSAATQKPSSLAPPNSNTLVENVEYGSDLEVLAAMAKSGGSMQKPPATAPSFTLRDAEKELRVKWKETLTDAERQDWTERAKKVQAERDAKKKVDADSNGPTDVPPAPSLGRVTPSDSNSAAASPITQVATASAVVSPDPTAKPLVSSVSVDQADAKPRASISAIVTKAPSKRPRNNKPPTTFSSRWRLNQDQINLCYEAGMEHFNQVMATVKARDLMRELQDGFDLLRERGAGRYDMELPAFDLPAFSFFTDLNKAPWMPIVRQILGNDTVLIHKGMFLSLPGAAPQVYHQDGPHLTQQYQKPCHAINVFVPLVDLTSNNGPTEFCLGTHILGQENHEADFVEVPKVSAGTPVIFDYRLGHRGLGNTSESCRPILYCTYASSADGKEFRDKVNFSRKRYHRLGDLVSKTPSREERKRKRDMLSEEQQVQRAMEASKL